MERMRVALSRAFAIIGMVSLMCVPVILVLIGLNSPRMLAGASGLGSQMSMWLGPPWRKTMMTDFALPNPRDPSSLPAAFAVPCQARKSTRFRPSRPMEPARRSSRLVGPSQVVHFCPGITSMESSSVVVQKCFAVDERPKQVLRLGRAAAGARAEILQAVLDLGGGRKTRPGSKIHFFHHDALRFFPQ